MAKIPVFVAALAIAYLVPGPDMILLLQTGAARGRRLALLAAIGLGTARAIHVALAALGLAALLQASPAVFEAARLAGAAYLAWLGTGILRSRSLLAQAAAADGAAGGAPRAILTGLLTNLLNPKALLFCSVLLPQFLRPEGGPLPAQFLLLGTVLVATGAVFDLNYALAGDRLGAFLSRHPLWERVQRWLFGSLLIAFGLRLALGGRGA